MAKTKQEWLYQLRRCSSVNTLEKIIHNQLSNPGDGKKQVFPVPGVSTTENHTIS
ncbi:hypothetical protein [Escherichia coli]|uniref:hypothetical protein n=1 Tax=Escherichia coli TaxID=562 RepID=UPI003F87511C